MSVSSKLDTSARMIPNGFTCRSCRFFAPGAVPGSLRSCILGFRTWSVDEWCSSWERKESDVFSREKSTPLHEGRS